MLILKMLRSLLAGGAFVAFVLATSALAGEPDNCSLKFTGSDRKAVKNRPVTTAQKENYTKFNGGSPISVDKWYEHVCEMDGQLPELKEISQTKPLPGIETVEITVRGFIVAAQFEENKGKPGPDNDFHMEVSGVTKWNSPHFIVEVPAGQEYCDARIAIAQEIRAESGKQHVPAKYKFKKPIEVEVTGYVFFDAHHATGCMNKNLDYCECDGGRGSRVSGKSKVKGLWEIHPVTAVKVLPH
jgi:hypothetical protein